MAKKIVSKNGYKDFNSIQAAIDSIKNDREETLIFIKSGIYFEKIWVNKKNVTLIGENEENTIIEYNDYALKLDEFGKVYTTYRTSSVNIEADDFRAKKITFVNSAGYGKLVEQAVAVQVSGDRCIFRNCSFKAFQDTFYTKGENSRIYLKKCFIEGDVDFIFGAATVVFEKCVISSINRTGYITAPSTHKNQKYGYLFENCHLISNLPKGSVYLGRPWHPAGDPDAIGCVIFRECELGEHINEDGWTEMKGFKAEDARFYEYKNRGKGAVSHVKRRQLSEEENLYYTSKKMLSGIDNWEYGKEF